MREEVVRAETFATCLDVPGRAQACRAPPRG
jgi:hypothetical protein